MAPSVVIDRSTCDLPMSRLPVYVIAAAGIVTNREAIAPDSINILDLAFIMSFPPVGWYRPSIAYECGQGQQPIEMHSKFDKTCV